METFLGIILTLIIFSYIFGKLLPYLLQWFIKRKIRQAQNGDGSQFGGFSSFGGFGTREPKQNAHQKEGEVHINRKNTQKRVKDNVGDYVDFEEINEK